MANKIILKRSSVSGKAPITSDLDYGELSINYTDGTLYYKNSGGTISTIGSNIANLRVTSNTVSNSSTSGALIVSGGTGIAGNLNVGGTYANLATGGGSWVAVTGGTPSGSTSTVKISGIDGSGTSGNTVNVQYGAQNGGSHSFRTGALQLEMVRISQTNGAVNYLNLTGAATGVGPSVSAFGTDANIDLSLVATGTGNITTSNPVRITNANVSTSTNTGALIVAGGAGISGNVFTGGYVYVNPTSVTDVAGGTYGTAIAVTGSNWGIYANIGYTGSYYLRQVVGKDSGNNIIVGHTGTTALNANINIWPGTGGTGYFNVINPFSTNPVFSVNTTANTVVVANAQASTSNVTGALQVAGGVGVAGNINASGNIYAIGTNSKHGYTWANSVSSAYTVFNSATNSIDTVFG
jgi:hypothetical protein